MNTLQLKNRFNHRIFSAENILLACIVLFPVLTLALHRWITVYLFIAFGAALYILIRNKKQQSSFLPNMVFDAWTWGLVVALIAPLTAIALGQIFRGEFKSSSYDNASRFFLALPIALVIIQNRINAYKLLAYVIPATIFVTAISVLAHPNLAYGEGRITSYFVDPLTFGSICLTLALLSLVSIDAGKRDQLWERLCKLAGFILGLYLSFSSGSRTGWLAIPIVLWLWLRFRKNIPHWVIAILVAIFCAGIYFSVPLVQARIDMALNEAWAYQWNVQNPDTSVGMRISFLRTGFFVFSQSPWGGWGDAGFEHLLNAPELVRFATEFTREFTFQAGFHNEFVTNMVRSGVWGLLSSLILFLMPIALFVKGLRSPSVSIRNYALIGISYMLCTLISGMSTEVFNLKFTAAFHAFMIASLSASLLAMMFADQPPKKS